MQLKDVAAKNRRFEAEILNPKAETERKRAEQAAAASGGKQSIVVVATPQSRLFGEVEPSLEPDAEPARRG
jgi:hypothetical protein